MPLTSKGSDILAKMKSEYGDEKGEQVFYASKNAGTISGVDSMDNVSPLQQRLDTMAEQVNSLGQVAASVASRMDAQKTFVVSGRDSKGKLYFYNGVEKTPYSSEAMKYSDIDQARSAAEKASSEFGFKFLAT